MAIKTPVVASENIKDKAFNIRGALASVLCVDQSNGDMYLSGVSSVINFYPLLNYRQCLLSNSDASMIWPPIIDSPSQMGEPVYYSISDGSGGFYSSGMNHARNIKSTGLENAWLDHDPIGTVRGILIDGSITYMWGYIYAMYKNSDGSFPNAPTHLCRFVNRTIRSFLEC